MEEDIDFVVDGFVNDLCINDLVNISTKDKPYKVLEKKFVPDPRFGMLWFLGLEEVDTGNNRHYDYVRPNGVSFQYYRTISHHNKNS